MGRIYKIILLVLLLTGLLVYVAPNLLSVKEIGASLVKQASSAMEAEITVGRLHWNWDPLPHLTLVDTTVTHRDFTLRLPDSRNIEELGQAKGPLPGEIALVQGPDSREDDL